MRSHAEVSNEINAVVGKTNSYIADVLNRFLGEKLDAIDQLSQEISLTPELTLKLKKELIARVASINFNAAYIDKKNLPREANGFDINYIVFSNYVLKRLPELNDLNTFAATVLGFADRKRAILSTLGEIRKAINAYTAENKKSFVDSFNKELDGLNGSLNKMGFLQVEHEAKTQTQAILTKLQNSENTYYNQFTLFAASRKSNSSLQPKITQAMSLLEKMDKQEVKEAEKIPAPRLASSSGRSYR